MDQFPQKPEDTSAPSEPPQRPESARSDDPSTQGQRPIPPSVDPQTIESGESAQAAVADYELKSARTLATVATVAGPISFIIGGVALSTVALVCAIIAFVKIRSVLDDVAPAKRPYARALRQTALMGIGIGAVALVLNGVSVAMMLPVLMEAMQTGDYSAILGDAASSLSPTSPSEGGGNAWG